MNTTIYWLSKYSHNDSTVKYFLQYDYDYSANWTSVPCPSPQWHNDSGKMSCGLLTCATAMDEYYDVRVKAVRNSSVGFVTQCSVFNPVETSEYVQFAWSSVSEKQISAPSVQHQLEIILLDL